MHRAGTYAIKVQLLAVDKKREHQQEGRAMQKTFTTKFRSVWVAGGYSFTGIRLGIEWGWKENMISIDLAFLWLNLAW